MFVGGEFYDDPRWIVEIPIISTENMTFLNGGKACLVVISDYLLDHGIKKVLLPSYLCPSIVTTLESCGLTCNYYQINPDFSIDLDDLDQKVTKKQAVYFINYFGFLHPEPVRTYLAGLRQKGGFVVEDNAQAGFSDHTTGDFIFNSIRKLAPYDGGYLLSSVDVQPYIEKYHGCTNRRLPLIRQYRQQLADYLDQGVDSYDRLVEMHRLAEAYYETDLVVEGDLQERRQIEHLDWKEMKRIRRKNYTYMLSLISEISELSPIFPVLQEGIMPLGLPVYVSGVSRDWLVDELGNAGIGLTVHWEELLYDARLNRNPVAVNMAGRILTLMTDHRTSHKQMDYLVLNLMDCIKKAKNS